MTNHDPKPNLLTWLYSAWVYLALTTIFVIILISNFLLPREKDRRIVSKYLAYLMCILTGISITRETKDQPLEQVIYVGNHSSYFDVPLVISTLAPTFYFVAKKELKNIPILGFYFRRLGTQFVDRYDPREARAGLENMEQAIEKGESLFFFPEGTFRATPGILPFRSGAFVLAERYNLPIVPVSIKGAREVLRDGRPYILRTPITVTIHPKQFLPQGLTQKEWKAKVQQIIASAVFEPILD